MRCRRCGYLNLLDPRRSPYVTDRRVIFAAQHASSNGRLWYTSRQVLGVLMSRRRRWWRRTASPAEMSVIIEAIPRFRDNGWELPGLIVAPTFENVAPPDYPEADLFDYGAERILVVDDAIVVDLLVRTGVHTDARVIIISTTGYPRQIVERAASLVSHRPDVPVHVLHASGVDLQAMVATHVRYSAHLTPYSMTWDCHLGQPERLGRSAGRSASHRSPLMRCRTTG